jgi:hypothetical protein
MTSGAVRRRGLSLMVLRPPRSWSRTCSCRILGLPPTSASRASRSCIGPIAKGRSDPFAEPSANDRCLRIPAEDRRRRRTRLARRRCAITMPSTVLPSSRNPFRMPAAAPSGKLVEQMLRQRCDTGLQSLPFVP